eukprot:CAMPEP_0175090070 /NCGR_PEP_ID=MMETSP0086_2-20121207/1130_1 /TAXON_ID=136419 /ORGANISM="Unknown Unknown, Strain D1" /LENGTH=280 /DNA_ID=CAMNT_0016362635 /DNA_START=139 /DNA_END=981 /DNA_ORIENTATION=+
MSGHNTDGMNKVNQQDVGQMVGGAWDTFATVGIKSDGMVAKGSTNEGTCHKCNKDVISSTETGHVRAKGKLFHSTCFKCDKCSKALQLTTSFEHEGKFFCGDCRPAEGDFKCGACGKQIQGERIDAINLSFCSGCFSCCQCDLNLIDKPHRSKLGKLYCKVCFKDKYPEEASAMNKVEAEAHRCDHCKEKIDCEFLEAEMKKFHINCFDEFKKTNLQENSKQCAGCKKPCNTWVEVSGKFFHPECWKCHNCDAVLAADNAAIKKGKFWCKPCIADPFRDV